MLLALYFPKNTVLYVSLSFVLSDMFLDNGLFV